MQFLSFTQHFTEQKIIYISVIRLLTAENICDCKITGNYIENIITRKKTELL